MKKIVKKYRTYTLSYPDAFASGRTYRTVAQSTIDFLRRQGIKEIIWTDGSFICL